MKGCILLFTFLLFKVRSLQCGEENIKHCLECGVGTNKNTCKKCEDKYFLFLENLLCLPCDDKIYGQIGCGGKCSLINSDPFSILCEKEGCKDGFYNLNNICQKCSDFDSKCGKCTYDPPSGYSSKKTVSRYFNCIEYANDQFSMEIPGESWSCLISGCNRCHFLLEEIKNITSNNFIFDFTLKGKLIGNVSKINIDIEVPFAQVEENGKCKLNIKKDKKGELSCNINMEKYSKLNYNIFTFKSREYQNNDIIIIISRIEEIFLINKKKEDKFEKREKKQFNNIYFYIIITSGVVAVITSVIIIVSFIKKKYPNNQKTVPEQNQLSNQNKIIFNFSNGISTVIFPKKVKQNKIIKKNKKNSINHKKKRNRKRNLKQKNNASVDNTGKRMVFLNQKHANTINEK